MHRLVLFDIDSTLIDAHGAGGRAIFRAIKDVYGLEGELGSYSFHGRTDPGIIHDLTAMWAAGTEPVAGERGTQPQVITTLAAGLGRSPAGIDRLLLACLARYVEVLREEISGGFVEVLPGIRQLVDALAADERVLLGLLTGNLQEGAHVKLEPTGLWPSFLVGAFGSDSPVRRDLPAVAVARAQALNGRRYAGKQIVVVGDTPADIECGAHLGVRTVAVATGRYSRRELLEFGPDHAFSDFSDWRAALAAVLSDADPPKVS